MYGAILYIGAMDDSRASAGEVRDNRAGNRFELETEGQVAFLDYERRPDAMVFIHTEVPAELRGRGLAERLVKAGLDTARREGLRIVAECPFVTAYMRKHPD
jgi:predicted GNAT family acetyltransferase